MSLHRKCCCKGGGSGPAIPPDPACCTGANSPGRPHFPLNIPYTEQIGFSVHRHDYSRCPGEDNSICVRRLSFEEFGSHSGQYSISPPFSGGGIFTCLSRNPPSANLGPDESGESRNYFVDALTCEQTSVTVTPRTVRWFPSQQAVSHNPTLGVTDRNAGASLSTIGGILRITASARYLKFNSAAPSDPPSIFSNFGGRPHTVTFSDFIGSINPFPRLVILEADYEELFDEFTADPCPGLIGQVRRSFVGTFSSFVQGVAACPAVGLSIEPTGRGARRWAVGADGVVIGETTPPTPANVLAAYQRSITRRSLTP